MLTWANKIMHCALSASCKKCNLHNYKFPINKNTLGEIMIYFLAHPEVLCRQRSTWHTISVMIANPTICSCNLPVVQISLLYIWRHSQGIIKQRQWVSRNITTLYILYHWENLRSLLNVTYMLNIKANLLVFNSDHDCMMHKSIKN